VETALCGFGYDARKGGFADPRRPPQDKGTYPAGVNHPAEYASRTYKMGLAYIFIKVARAQPLGKWSKHQ